MVDLIRQLATRQGLTLKSLEKTLNIANGNIAKWDTSSPNIRSVKKVADFFGISVDYLLDGVARELPPKLTDGQQQLLNAVANVRDIDCLMLAGAILQEIRQHGRFDAAAFLAGEPAAAPASAAPMGNTVALPGAKKGRQQDADGRKEKMIFVPDAARGGPPLTDGGVWVTQEQYDAAAEALAKLPPIDPNKIKGL